jgi:hypothetical protein
MMLVQNYYVIKQVPAIVPNPAFGGSILPRAAEACLLRCDAEALDGVHHFFTEVLGAIEDQILRCQVVGDRLTQLLRDPKAVGVRRPSEGFLQIEGLRRRNRSGQSLQEPFKAATFNIGTATH